jgi:hypothetical protein
MQACGGACASVAVEHVLELSQEHVLEHVAELKHALLARCGGVADAALWLLLLLTCGWSPCADACTPAQSCQTPLWGT